MDLGIRGRKALLFGASRGLGKACALALAQEGVDLTIVARKRDVLEKAGLAVERVYKVKEGRPNVVDYMKGDKIQIIVNTPHGPDPLFDDKAIRRALDDEKNGRLRPL